MRCLSLDFPDVEMINPAYAYKISVGYILSDFIELMGSNVVLFAFERGFPELTLAQKAELVSIFHTNEPESKLEFDDFIDEQKRKKSIKHMPNHQFISLKKWEKTMERVLNNWMISLQSMMKEAGFFSFYECFDLGVFNVYFFVDTNEKIKDNSISIEDMFRNKTPTGTIDNTILLLAEGFYNETIFEDGAITDIDLIEAGKPYLIKCLDLPNLNTLTSPEMSKLKNQIHPHISLFKAETEAWTNLCYTERNGISYFKEKVMPTMQLVQETIVNDSVLRQWDNIDEVKLTSAIYFGEVTPTMIWKYYKNARVIKPELYDFLIADYLLKESYTIPVMVFAYNKHLLKLAVEQQFDIAELSAVLSVKKHLEVE